MHADGEGDIPLQHTFLLPPTPELTNLLQARNAVIPTEDVPDLRRTMRDDENGGDGDGESEDGGLSSATARS